MLKALKGRVKEFLASWAKVRRERELEATTPHITRAEIARDLQSFGVDKGDTIFLHSSLKSLGYVEGGPTAVLEAFMDALGPEGTLMLPAYHMPGGSIYAACHTADYVFDPRVHGTEMGALPEALLRMSGVRRSIHPTHSCAAFGARAAFLTEAHHLAPSVFGKGSPWARAVEINAKVMGLGISMGPVTFYHLLEDEVGDRFPLPVRSATEHQIRCKGWQGEDWTVPVRPLDPAFQPRRIDHPSRADLRRYFMEEFTRAGLLRGGTIGTARSWYIEARSFRDHLCSLMLRGITIYSAPESLVASGDDARKGGAEARG